ncbi:caspase domain-containing protein [Suillus variegatus]|nr:caspase domain-containing protein [Suillus variegatus]
MWSGHSGYPTSNNQSGTNGAPLHNHHVHPPNPPVHNPTVCCPTAVSFARFPAGTQRVALDHHHQYQEITILDTTIIVVIQVTLLATIRLLKVLPLIMHCRLAFHPQSYGAPPAPPPGRQGPPQYLPPPGPPGNYPPPPGPPRGYGPPPPQVSGGYAYAPPSGPPQRPPQEQQFYGSQIQGPNQMQQPFFQYSQCNGKKKALCIGINYLGQPEELHGCINDANNIKRFLASKSIRYGMRVLSLGIRRRIWSYSLTMRETNANFLLSKTYYAQWNGSFAMPVPHDSLFFHYSGHGGQTEDLDGDEEDGYDEVIYPVDFKEKGHIVDDLMHDIMVKRLPPGCRLTAIFDSCHSGSALDLPFVYSTEGKIKEPNLAAEAGQSLISVTGLIKTARVDKHKAETICMTTKTSPADCISWSGCKDSQTSSDTEEAGRATGAMSYAFIKALRDNPQQSYQQLLNSIREILRAKYSQKPQLSSSHPMDTNILFIA